MLRWLAIHQMLTPLIQQLIIVAEKPFVEVSHKTIEFLAICETFRTKPTKHLCLHYHEAPFIAFDRRRTLRTIEVDKVIGTVVSLWFKTFADMSLIMNTKLPCCVKQFYNPVHPSPIVSYLSAALLYKSCCFLRFHWFNNRLAVFGWYLQLISFKCKNEWNCEKI